MELKSLADRANLIEDPAAKVHARRVVYDLAFPEGFTPFKKGTKPSFGKTPGGPPKAIRKKLAAKGKAIPNKESGGSFPITDVASLKNAIKAFGRAKDKAKAKRHIISQARKLGASNLIPKQWGVADLAVHVQRQHILDLATMTSDDKAAIDAIKKSAKQTLSTLGPLLGKIADQRVLGAAVRQVTLASDSMSQTRWWADSPAVSDWTAEEQEYIDLAMTKDGRKSFKRQGKWGHGFVPLDAKAKESKAKGSPIAAKRISRLFDSPSKQATASRAATTATMKQRAAHSSAHGNVLTAKGKAAGHAKGASASKGSTERVQNVGQSIRADIKESSPKNRVPLPGLERGKGRRAAPRATKAWASIPENQKTVRNGTKYVMSTFNGKNMLTKWLGENPGQAAPDASKRQFREARSVELNQMTTAQLRKLVKSGKQPPSVVKKANILLKKKMKAAAHG